jgi:hypothetical protein
VFVDFVNSSVVVRKEAGEDLKPPAAKVEDADPHAPILDLAVANVAGEVVQEVPSKVSICVPGAGGGPPKEITESALAPAPAFPC